VAAQSGFLGALAQTQKFACQALEKLVIVARTLSLSLCLHLTLAIDHEPEQILLLFLF
jgi:hypothetical protein